MTHWPQELVGHLVAGMEDTIAWDEDAVGAPLRTHLDDRTSRLRLIAIAEKLLAAAVEKGLIPRLTPRFRELAGGNTASLVSIASTDLEFVFKADVANPKLVREARTIEDLRNDPRLRSFRLRLPQVYALFEEGPPFAYLMEYFPQHQFPSMKAIFFDRAQFSKPTPEHGASILTNALTGLADAYRQTRDARLTPRMMGEAYFDRLHLNLLAASEVDEIFAPVELTINGVGVPPWSMSLEIMRSHESLFQQLAPPFVTVVHGDPNPGNILIKRDGDHVADVKFIDLKDWKLGDYLFDMAKIFHYLLHTGPIEDLGAYKAFTAARDATGVVINFTLEPDSLISATLAHGMKLVEELAAELGDSQWATRLKLAMAANLIGLLPSRLADGRRTEALLFYAAGMGYLQDFMDSWTSEEPG